MKFTLGLESENPKPTDSIDLTEANKLCKGIESFQEVGSKNSFHWEEQIT